MVRKTGFWNDYNEFEENIKYAPEKTLQIKQEEVNRI